MAEDESQIPEKSTGDIPENPRTHYVAIALRNAGIEISEGALSDLVFRWDLIKKEAPWKITHANRVAAIADSMARFALNQQDLINDLKLSDDPVFPKDPQAANENLQKFRVAALLHDIGQSDPDILLLLNKETLTDDELKLMQQHPDRARELMKQWNLPPEIILYSISHHEKQRKNKNNGNGGVNGAYPRTIQKDNGTERRQSLGAWTQFLQNVLATADQIDTAMGPNRPYNPDAPRLTQEQMLQDFSETEGLGTLPDPLLIVGINKLRQIQ